MENFNEAKNYRDNLAKDLKGIRKGNILDRTKDLFLSEEEKDKKINERHQKSQDFLSQKRFSNEYQSAQDITHPEILQKIKTERERWVIESKERVEKERSNNIEKFKKEFPGFESFLENKDFSFLVENGVTIVPIKKDSEQFKKILDTEPHRNEYGFQYAYISNEGTGVKIITENKTMDVLPKVYNENDMADGQPQIEESAGETVREALKRLESFEKVGIAIYPDNSYRNYSLELEYGFNRTGNLTPFLEKLDPEFFKGGGEYVGGSYGSEDISIFKNKNGERKIIPLKNLGSFLKQDTTLYLCEE